MDPIWKEYPHKYTSLSNESKAIILHPFLAEVIQKLNIHRILDYGCGDGELIKLLQNDMEFSLFDVSSKVLDMAKLNLKKINPRTYYSLQDIPRNYFDCVVLSLVLMTIDNQMEFKETLKTVYDSLNQTGHALIAITHPCFRDKIFSTFHTSYSKGENFRYLNEGSAFTVYLKDDLESECISFTDYHWSLSFTQNAITEVGLKIEKIFELPDSSKTNGYINTDFSPYLVFLCKRDKKFNG